jgi:hypothetical protein
VELHVLRQPKMRLKPPREIISFRVTGIVSLVLMIEDTLDFSLASCETG